MTLPDESEDLHEWVSFDIDGDTYQFDVTWLTSPWTCIYGDGCLGILTEASPELEHGCCSYGAHFVDKADRKEIARLAARLDSGGWQFKKRAAKLGGPIHKTARGEWVTRVWDGACIFLNRPGFSAGAGCALHQKAMSLHERPIAWKPRVCWQLPLRLDVADDDLGHRTFILREWKRRDWDEGGQEFHWWCTESPDAFAGHRPVFRTLRDEIVELVGAIPYAALADYVSRRGSETFLPHPALKKRLAEADR